VGTGSAWRGLRFRHQNRSTGGAGGVEIGDVKVPFTLLAELEIYWFVESVLNKGSTLLSNMYVIVITWFTSTRMGSTVRKTEPSNWPSVYEIDVKSYDLLAGG
jgi:hypothetical protein